MGIEENIAARKAAVEVFEFAEQCLGDHVEESYWRKLRDLVLAKCPLKPSKKGSIGMTDAELRRFGRELMPFGEFMGKRVDEVPLERLSWYADWSFVDQLRRYLKSERIVLERASEH